MADPAPRLPVAEPASVELLRWTGTAYVPALGEIRPWIGEAELKQAEGWSALLHAAGEADRDWDWRKLRESTGGPREGYSLLVEGELQGLMLVDLDGQVTRITREPLLYVDRLAAAPWNRAHLSPRRRFRLSGDVLMEYARKRSVTIGCAGRIGLHPYTGAAGFYRRIGMGSFDPVPGDDGFPNFEFPQRLL